MVCGARTGGVPARDGDRWQRTYELGWIYTQSSSDRKERGEGGIDAAAFKLPDVGAVKTAAICQRFLTQFEILAKVLNPVAEHPADFPYLGASLDRAHVGVAWLGCRGRASRSGCTRENISSSVARSDPDLRVT